MVDRESGDRVKVVDRRWLTAEGNPREGAPAVEPAATATVHPQAPPAPAPLEEALPAADETPPDSSVGLVDVVDFFAQQALATMTGDVPGRPQDLVAARYFIDMLGVVQSRTAGQLVAEEARYLEDILFQLRSLYVAATR